MLAFLACGPPPAGPPDASVEEDGGEPSDASVPDAGRDAGTADAGFQRVPVEEWCQSWAWAECSRDVRCGRLENKRFDECTARRLEKCDQAAYIRSVNGGSLQYFPEQGAKCLNGYAEGSCFHLPADCDGLFQGLVGPDGGCLLPQDCDSQGFCFTYSNTCPYRCIGYVGMGETCDGWTRRCNPSQATCQMDGGVRVCAPPRGVGESCPDYTECRSDLACYLGVCVRREAKVGEACNELGIYPQCGPDAFCRLGPKLPDGGQPGTCQKRVGLGGVCAGYGSCLPNLRCSNLYQTGTCIALGSEGETCNGYGDCKDELYCRPSTSTCRPLPRDGGDCTHLGSSYACAVGYYCDFTANPYSCAARRPAGASCNYDGVCQSGRCEYGALADGGFGNRCVVACSQRPDGG